jgi:hypothetical protein
VHGILLKIFFSGGHGKGATFTLTLKTALSPSLTLDASTNKVSDIATSGSRILLVEDNKTTNLVMTKLLMKMGHQVQSAFRLVEMKSSETLYFFLALSRLWKLRLVINLI